MIRVAVVDDEAEERSRIKKCLDYIAQVKQTDFHVDEYASTESFLMHYDAGYDLIFMDIVFEGGRSGMDAAHALRKIDRTVALVFVTNMAQMAIQGYEVDALDFILKPVTEPAFLLKMNRIMGRLELKAGRTILLKSQGEGIRVNVSRIRYLLVQGHYVEYHSRDGVFSQYVTLSAAEKELDDPSFVRCDRGCLVNLHMVSRVTRDTCMVDGEELPIARTQRTTFLHAYSNFLSGYTA